jgi:hypothetical protein
MHFHSFDVAIGDVTHAFSISFDVAKTLLVAPSTSFSMTIGEDDLSQHVALAIHAP